MVNLKSKQAFRIVEEILRQKTFTQYGLSKKLDVSFGMINYVTNWLLEKGFIEKKKSNYALMDVGGLLNAISLYRDMEKIKMFELRTALNEKELFSLLPKGAIIGLDNALIQYSTYFRSNRVCAYVTKAEMKLLRKKLFFRKGNKATISLYEEKPKVSKKVKIGKHTYTDEIRTIIDMASDKKTYAAEPLIKKVLGVKNEN